MPVRDGPSCPGCGLPNYEGLCPHCRGDRDAYERELVPPFPTTREDIGTSFGSLLGSGIMWRGYSRKGSQRMAIKTEDIMSIAEVTRRRLDEFLAQGFDRSEAFRLTLVWFAADRGCRAPLIIREDRPAVPSDPYPL